MGKPSALDLLQLQAELTPRKESPVPEAASADCWTEEEKIRCYESAQRTLENIIDGLREQARDLELENRRLWRENERLKRKLFGPVVFGFHCLGFHMEAADID